MYEGKRPGGLTAMAIFNFIFAGYRLLTVGGSVAFILLGEGTQPHEQMMDAFEKAGLTSLFLVLIFSLGAVTVVFELLSAIGYLKQRKILGRLLGNLYALICILSNLISIVCLPDESGMSFSLISMVFLIYPTLTLILLNTTFKEDFIH